MIYKVSVKSGVVVGLVLLVSMMLLSCDSETDAEYPDNPSVYYVSIQGDDQDDGQSAETAFRTIRHALELVQPGDTILILPGTYAEALTLEDIGSQEAPITIRGEGDGVVLDGQKSGGMNIGIWCEQVTNLVFENLEIRYYTDIGIGVSLSSNVVMRDLTIHHNGMVGGLPADWEIEGYGLHAEESTYVTIENNDVYANGPQPQSPGRLLGTGINTFKLTDSVIRNNRSYDNIGGGILVEDSVNVLVEDNEVYSNDLDASAEEWWDGGIWLDGGHDVTVRNNIFRDNKGPGIEISDEDHQKPYGYVLENNTSTGNYHGIYIWNFGTSDFPAEDILRLSNNQISGNTRKDVWIVDWECPPPDPCED